MYITCAILEEREEKVDMKQTYTVIWYDDNDHEQKAYYTAESEAEVSDAFFFEHQMGENEDGTDKEIDYRIVEGEW